MKKKTTPKKKRAPKINAIVFDFDSIKLNNAALLNDNSLNVAYQKFLMEVDDSFNTLFNQ